MNVFIIGGTGYLGGVVVERLFAAGHAVTGLARSQESAERLSRVGATPVLGSLSDVDVLTTAARAADAVVYAASDYTPTDASMQVELDAVSALVAGVGARPGVPLVYTSTGLVYGVDPVDATEDAVLPEVSAQPVKAKAERIVLGAPGGIVFRAGLVFGRGGTGLVTGLIAAAKADGASTYIDSGENAWYPVHVEDLADLYLRAVEHPVPGVFNAVGETPFTFRDLAAAIGELTGTPAVSVPLAVAEQRMGPAVRSLTSSSHLVATKARAAYGWEPRPISLVEDVRHGSYALSAEQ